MREWLLRLLGASKPIVIELDNDAIQCARPGDLVILKLTEKLSPEILLAARHQLAEMLKQRALNVGFCVCGSEWEVRIEQRSQPSIQQGQ